MSLNYDDCDKCGKEVIVSNSHRGRVLCSDCKKKEAQENKDKKMSSIFKVGQKIELLDIKALGLNYEYENGDIFIVANVDDDGDAVDSNGNFIKEGHIQLGYARILPENLKPRDLACFYQVASVIGEDKAEQELKIVIGTQELKKEADLRNAFEWRESLQNDQFWADICMGIYPYQESRIDIIGQNGNDGEHYDDLAETSNRISEKSIKEQVEFVAVSNESQQALDEVHGGYKDNSIESNQLEYTGGSVSYYKVKIDNPTTLPNAYEAECNDIIEALQMNYAEGNAFKAIWRKCAARLGSAKKGYTDGLYDSEKVVFFGERMVAQEKNLKQ